MMLETAIKEIENSIARCELACFLCEENCRKGLLAKIKPYGFTLFVKRYGIEENE